MSSQKYQADSNIALLGSELEKKVRMNSSDTEEAWKKAGKQVGTNIWRIENFKVVPWPKENYGFFYSGDSYIILNTHKKNPEDKKLVYDVHFWLGRDTSQDEAGTAAYKTVELDDYLGGAPVQHREIQDCESELLMSYFDKIMVQAGGIDSGFKKVKPEEYRTRLLHVKGTKNRVTIREVPKTYKSLNSGDVFVLDGGKNIYQWNGKASNGTERHRAAELCRTLDGERKAENDGDLDPFWQLLGDKGPVKSAQEGGDDAASKQLPKKLYRLSNASGNIEFTYVSELVRRSYLDTNDVFIVDAVEEIFVWVGKKANAEEKRMAMQYAQSYLNAHKRPSTLPVTRILESGETDSFLKCIDPEEYKGYIPKKNPHLSREALTGESGKPNIAERVFGSKDVLNAPAPSSQRK